MVKLLKLITLVCQRYATEPELATVGYSEAQAKEEGLIKASKFICSKWSCIIIETILTDLLNLLHLKEDDTLIGAQVVGTGASDIISELGLAIEAGMNAEDIALTIHASTLGEMTMEAAEKLSDAQSIQCNN